MALGDARALIACGLVLVACSVDELENVSVVPKIINTCEVDEQCRTSAQRGTCGSGMCVASSGELSSVFLEVLPPAFAFWGAGESFLLSLDNLSHGDWNRDISLSKLANLTGRVTTNASLLGEPASESCAQVYDTSSQSMRMHLELSRSEASLGLPGWSITTNAEKAKNGGWEFKASVPAGTYDIYAVPLGGCDADFPPVLAQAQVIETDVALELHVGALATLAGLVTPPLKGDKQHTSLAGWQVSLIEPDRGRVISTTRKLNDSNPTNFEIRYQAIADAAPLLQLSPPKDVTAPAIFWDLSVLDLDGDGQVQPSLANLDLSTVQVSGSVVDEELNPVAEASVRIRSSQLLGAAQGLTAQYETTTTSDADGEISLSLLPGTYQVMVTPPNRLNLAMAETTWTIGRSPASQAGRTLELSSLSLVEGIVLDPMQARPIEGVPVNMMPSTFRIPPFFDRLLETSSASPRASSGFTDSQGAFAIGTDPGLVDISVRSKDTSNFPWLVRARTQSPTEPFGAMFLGFPVPVVGSLQDPTGNPIQQALLRVFAPIKDEERGVRGDGVLQVAEGRTDKNGRFTLLLPSRLRDD